jgi:hypothetical protein
MAIVAINGVTITTSDKSCSISVRNGRVVVDGEDVTPDTKEITVSVQGDVSMLEVDVCEKVSITGSAGTISTKSGDVQCGDVTGDVHTNSGDVHCGAIAGSIKTKTGDVTCTRIVGPESRGQYT